MNKKVQIIKQKLQEISFLMIQINDPSKYTECVLEDTHFYLSCAYDLLQDILENVNNENALNEYKKQKEYEQKIMGKYIPYIIRDTFQ